MVLLTICDAVIFWPPQNVYKGKKKNKIIQIHQVSASSVSITLITTLALRDILLYTNLTLTRVSLETDCLFCLIPWLSLIKSMLHILFSLHKHNQTCHTFNILIWSMSEYTCFRKGHRHPRPPHPPITPVNGKFSLCKAETSDWWPLKWKLHFCTVFLKRWGEDPELCFQMPRGFVPRTSGVDVLSKVLWVLPFPFQPSFVKHGSNCCFKWD